jgi:hypothetical protein
MSAGKELSMQKACSFLIGASLVIWAGSALASCDEPYGVCMAECATTNSPERCMQRCRESLDRCSKTGIFQMPLAYKWKQPLGEAARAQALRPHMK